ncbi:MAG: ABC transporter permease [Bacteroidales bacterium]|nr:ABC transporter permease [Bacteroidales bacterium]
MNLFSFKAAFRRLQRNPVYTSINIIGLSIALSATFLILNFIFQELKTDRFHSNKERIYRVLSQSEGRDYISNFTQMPLGPALKDEFPGIQNFVRIHNVSFIFTSVKIKLNNDFLDEFRFIYADQSFFDIFSFPLISGDHHSFQDTPNGIIISEKTAFKYFGTTNPVGQNLIVKFPYKGPQEINFTVVGIMKNFPVTSSIQTDFVANFKKLEFESDDRISWGSYGHELFLMLNQQFSDNEITSNIPRIIEKNYRYKSKRNWQLQSLKDIYLHSKEINDSKAKGSLPFIHILTLISILIICVAGFNYIILNTSRSTKHLMANGIQKTLGAKSSTINTVHLIESFLQISIAFILAVIAGKALQPFINKFMNQEYEFILTRSWPLFLIALLISLIIGILSGLSLTFLTNKLKPFDLLHKIPVNYGNPYGIRRFLVISQIIIFTGLITCSIVLIKQIHFIKHKNPGCDFQNTISLGIPFDKAPAFINELKKSPYISEVSNGSSLPVVFTKLGTFKTYDKEIKAQLIIADHHFLDVYKIKLKEGRNLNPDLLPKKESDFFRSGNKIIEVMVNESFVKMLNVNDPIGILIKGNGISQGQIVGIVKDFHYQSLHNLIIPLVFAYDLPTRTYLNTISYKAGYFNEANNVLNEKYNQFFPERLYLPSVFDFNQTYGKEVKFAQIIIFFTFLTIIIASLGLIGLSLFIAEQKTKEIGIRKVNGAKVSEIVKMLNYDFIKWLVIAFVIACPVAYYTMSKWLQNFAYKTTLSWWIFALAGLLALVITLLTVSLQGYRAATRNPVEALRYE